MKSWKTTVFGVCAIMTAVAGAVSLLGDGDPATNPDWTAVCAAVAAGIGLIAARDNKVSSEDVGVK
ncbi:MAG TPA: hypothetical protein PK280_21435 [Planctomycetota bacterium]|nr:hypothetical protein [Planctomycetota bacterium]